MKFKINPFLRLCYLFVLYIVQTSFGIFYKKEIKHNQERFTRQGPCIIICNHPNTMVDVMNVAKSKKTTVHFLANASMFSTAFTNWFFTTFFTIKVERPKDVDGRRIDNKDSFIKAAEFLGRYGTLLIAAEGTSKLERRLRKLKTGSARIAFDTMKRNNWNLPLCFLPVGITYENPKMANYDLFYNYGEPIEVVNYKEQYEADPNKAVKQLTKDVQSSMQNLLLHTEPEDDDVDKLVQKLERIHKNEFGNKHGEQWFISKRWIGKFLDLKYKHEDKYQSLKKKINNYCYAITQNKLTDQSIQEKGSTILKWLGLIVFSAPAAIGWVNSIPAFHLPDFAIRKAKLYPGYTATVKLMLTVFLCPIFYWIQWKLITLCTGSSIWYTAYVGAAILLGYFALYYYRRWKQYQADFRWNRLKKQNHTLYNNIKDQRADIVTTVFSQLRP